MWIYIVIKSKKYNLSSEKYLIELVEYELPKDNYRFQKLKIFLRLHPLEILPNP